MNLVAVLIKELYAELDLICDSLTRWLLSTPQFEVLDLIVQFVPINVVNVFVGVQRPPEMALHDQTMREHVLATPNGGTVVSAAVHPSGSVRGLQKCIRIAVASPSFIVGVTPASRNCGFWAGVEGTVRSIVSRSRHDVLTAYLDPS